MKLKNETISSLLNDSQDSKSSTSAHSRDLLREHPFLTGMDVWLLEMGLRTYRLREKIQHLRFPQKKIEEMKGTTLTLEDLDL